VDMCSGFHRDQSICLREVIGGTIATALSDRREVGGHAVASAATATSSNPDCAHRGQDAKLPVTAS
jgi:hypothetical protein